MALGTTTSAMFVWRKFDVGQNKNSKHCVHCLFTHASVVVEAEMYNFY